MKDDMEKLGSQTKIYVYCCIYYQIFAFILNLKNVYPALKSV